MLSNPYEQWKAAQLRMSQIRLEANHDSLQIRPESWLSRLEFWLGSQIKGLGERLQQHSRVLVEPCLEMDELCLE